MRFSIVSCRCIFTIIYVPEKKCKVTARILSNLLTLNSYNSVKRIIIYRLLNWIFFPFIFKLSKKCLFYFLDGWFFVGNALKIITRSEYLMAIYFSTYFYIKWNEQLHFCKYVGSLHLWKYELNYYLVFNCKLFCKLINKIFYYAVSVVSKIKWKFLL